MPPELLRHYKEGKFENKIVAWPPGYRHRCRLFMGQRSRFPRDQFGRHADVLRIAAAARKVADIADNLVSHADVAHAFMRGIDAGASN